MEIAVDDGKVRQLGLSNFYRLEDIVYAYDNARIKPKVVQNRFYAQSGHDVEIREFCKNNDIEYQSFWTLTGNPDAFNHQAAQELAKQKNLSPEAVRSCVLLL
jgi:diketogulonate reductase-like aldo/keto reductase